MEYWLGVLGAWLFSDAVYSYHLYRDKNGYHGDRQSWRRDHWIRAVRGIIAVVIIIIGAVNY